MSETINTSITKQFGVKYPIFLAGMSVAAGPELCASVTNAGGIGVLAAFNCRTPDQLEELLVEMKTYLKDPDNAVFGVDIVIPKVGSGARKTNKHYHEGPIVKFLEVIVKYGAKLVVTAVGAPSKEICEYLHGHGIALMSMIGDVKHLNTLLGADGPGLSRVDMVCCQGGEGGGHTGSVPSSLLIPSVVDAVKGYKSVLTGNQIQVVAAGGMYCGRSLLAALAYGASAIWVGTRFVVSKESGSPLAHKKKILQAGFSDTTRTVVYTGRPLRVFRSKYVHDWETNRRDEILNLTSQGIIPFEHDLEKIDLDVENEEADQTPYLMGETAAVVKRIQPAAEIVEEIMAEAVEQIKVFDGCRPKL